VATKTDVLVVGGGIVGQVAAIEIASTGASTIVVDAGRDSGSTANAGSLHVQMQSRFMRLYPDQVPALEASLPLYCAAVREWDHLDKKYGPFGMVRNGGLMLAETVDQMEFLKAKAEREHRANVDVEILDRDALDEMAPWLGPQIIGAELCRNEGKLDPLAANLRLREEASRLGVQFAQDQITSIDERDGKAVAVGSTDTWHADRIVLAAAWGTGSLLSDLGLAMPTNPEPLHMNITEPCAAQIGHLVQHADRSITLKQLAGGQVVIGGGWPADDRSMARVPGVRCTSLVGNVALAARLVPSIGKVRVLRTWAGINTTIDGASTVGPVPNAKRIIVAVPGDAGYTLGPLVAKMAASFVTGSDQLFDAGAFSPARFAV